MPMVPQYRHRMCTPYFVWTYLPSAHLFSSVINVSTHVSSSTSTLSQIFSPLSVPQPGRDVGVDGEWDRGELMGLGGDAELNVGARSTARLMAMLLHLRREPLASGPSARRGYPRGVERVVQHQPRGLLAAALFLGRRLCPPSLGPVRCPCTQPDQEANEDHNSTPHRELATSPPHESKASKLLRACSSSACSNLRATPKTSAVLLEGLLQPPRNTSNLHRAPRVPARRAGRHRHRRGTGARAVQVGAGGEEGGDEVEEGGLCMGAPACGGDSGRGKALPLGGHSTPARLGLGA